MIQVVSVVIKDQFVDSKAAGLLADIKEFLGIKSVEDLKIVKKYYLEGVSKADAERMASELLSEEIWQKVLVDDDFFEDADFVREVAYLPGMMNPESQSISSAAKTMGINSLVALDSGWSYNFYGTRLTENEVNEIMYRLVMNKTIERLREKKPETLIMTGISPKISTVSLRNLSDVELMKLSDETLFLNLEEMKVIQRYFNEIGRDPTDAELETLAQTWSEHCVHKTFKAKLIVDGREKEPLFTRLMNITKEIDHELVLSAFKDNSGVIDFGDGWAVCGKVETHNSPSAIEPYGGAATGSGGVFRDIAGTGKGAKVVAGTDIFCVAPPDINEENIPAGCLHPRYILRRVVTGVRDYGNRMGIPTNNGSVHFHEDYRAKPSVIVGAYGLMKKEDAIKETPAVGDLIVVLGGKTGRDGIHGATFSSGEMHEKTGEIHSSAVQIGNAIEEKRVFDAILEMADQGLIKSITDCGAGGFSSAIGEMGEKIGVSVQLDSAPLKYSGLAPWEIWISESQERMVLAVAQKHIDEVTIIAKKLNVEASILGMFTGDKRLVVSYGNENLIDLEMAFLHDGLPQRILQGKLRPSKYEEPEIEESGNLGNRLLEIMKNLNIASKEPIYRQYDHNVQGTSVISPYSGRTFKSPCDAAVIEPVPGLGRGLAIAHGMNPVLNKIDPYFGSLWAIFEAVANAVACGANPEKIALIDNFIWPFPDEFELANLDRSVDACVDAARLLQMPFISGKDSLSSTFKKSDGSVIKIPPTLCISAFGHVDDVTKAMTSNFKKKGNKVAIIGITTDEMGGSAYYDLFGEIGNSIPKPEPEKARAALFSTAHAIMNGLARACHDISEGGLIAALAEMCFGEKTGVKVDLDLVPFKGENRRADFIAFNEAPARFVIEFEEDNLSELEELFAAVDWAVIGEVTDNEEVRADFDGQTIIDKGVNELREAWESPMRKVFGNF